MLFLPERLPRIMCHGNSNRNNLNDSNNKDREEKRNH